MYGVEDPLEPMSCSATVQEWLPQQMAVCQHEIYTIYHTLNLMMDKSTTRTPSGSRIRRCSLKLWRCSSVCLSDRH